MTEFTRRNMMLSTTAGLAAVGLVPAACTSRATAQPVGSPNIIFILADDMGMADASCYGAPQIRTPAIDRIAREGMRFTDAYANSAVCTASRVAIITGRYQYRLPVGLEEPLGPTNQVGVPPGTPTLPAQLQAAGYETTLIGKWHLGSLPEYDPQKTGYDHFWGFRGGAVDYFSHEMRGAHDLWDGPTEIHEQGYLTELLGDRAVDVVRAHERSSKPYFLSLHFNAPHWPWEGPDDLAESQRIGPNTSHGDGGTLATYNEMTEYMDGQIGRILDALDRTGQRDNTIVIFTSDNGGERFSTTWPFTGRKAELLEGGIRVPAVVRWPNGIPAGQDSDQTMMHMDWTPTLLAAAGIVPDTSFPTDGMDLMPVMTGRAASSDRRLFWRYKSNTQRAVREGPYKALKIGENSFLFNIVDDPMERANLKDRLPDVFERLTQAWNEWNTEMLPQSASNFTYNNTGAQWPDHMANPRINLRDIDDGGPWPNQPVVRGPQEFGPGRPGRPAMPLEAD